MNWSKALSSLALTLLAGGIAWLVSSVVHGGEVMAVHESRLAQQETRTAEMEAVVKSLAEDRKVQTAILDRLERQVDRDEQRDEAPKRRVR